MEEQNFVMTEIIFTIHTVIIIIVILLCFKVKLWAILAIGLLWGIHLWYFKGCILTMWQRQYDGKPKDYTYFREVKYRLTGIDEKVTIIVQILAITCLTICLYSTYQRYKIKHCTNQKFCFRDFIMA